MPYQNQHCSNRNDGSRVDVLGHYVPARAFFFAVVEEPGKDGFLVRKIYASSDNRFIQRLNLSEQQIKVELSPEKYGIDARHPDSKISVSQHVLGMNNSKYTSASTLFPEGSPRMSGRSIFIDVHRAMKAGARIVETREIMAQLEAYKVKHPHLSEKIALYGSWVREIDKEVLLHGRPVPARAVFNESSLRLTLGLTKTARVVQVVGVFFTAYDLTAAAQQSVEIKSARPITKEVMRQAGGWGAAWAGAKIGAAAGATVGIETGPGVIVTGLVGGIIGGSLGYWGADWVVDQME